MSLDHLGRVWSCTTILYPSSRRQVTYLTVWRWSWEIERPLERASTPVAPRWRRRVRGWWSCPCEGTHGSSHGAHTAVTPAGKRAGQQNGRGLTPS